MNVNIIINIAVADPVTLVTSKAKLIVKKSNSFQLITDLKMSSILNLAKYQDPTP